jgi:hypothetical protein
MDFKKSIRGTCAAVAAAWQLFFLNETTFARLNEQNQDQTEQPNPVELDKRTASTHCTFNSFKNPQFLARLPVTLTWNKDALTPGVKANLRLTARTKTSAPKAFKFEGAVSQNQQQLFLKVDRIIESAKLNKFGFTRLPVTMEFMSSPATTPSQTLVDENARKQTINLDLCTFGDLQEGTYQVSLSSLPARPTTQTPWFRWEQGNPDAPHTFIAKNTAGLKHIGSALAESGSFRIMTARFNPALEGVYYIKDGDLIGKLKNTEADNDEIAAFKSATGATIAFFGVGSSWIKLEGTFAQRLELLNDALMANDSVFIASQGRIIDVEKDDIKTKAAIIRATIIGAEGFFKERPEIK